MPRHSLLSLFDPTLSQWWKSCCVLALFASNIFVSSLICVGQDDSFEPLQRNVKVLSTNLDGFGIPFKVADTSGQFIEVQLYTSRDKGKSWSFHSRQPTSAREFPFTAEGDGEYWFAIKTLDRNRRLMPDGDARAELKIFVDSEKPKLEFQIESDAAGRVVCRWQASDASLDVDTFKIQYRASAGELLSDRPIDDSWNTVPVQLKQNVAGENWADQLAWWPETSDEQLEVRMQIADSAGNLTSINRYVAVRKTNWRKSSSGSTLGTARSQNGIAPAAEPNPINVVEDTGASKWQTRLKPISNPAVNSHSAQPQIAESSGNRWRINDESSDVARPGTLPARNASRPLPPGVSISAPPVPLDWNESDFSQNAAGLNESSSTPWESEIQNRESSERSFIGSTMSPSPNLAPRQNTLRPRVTDSIPSNPGTMIRSGKNIISESTTSWPNNQWNGPPAKKVNPEIALAPSVKNKLVPLRRSNSNLPPRDSFTERSNFSNAGFRKNQSAPIAEASSVQPSQAAMPDTANTQIISTKRFQLNYDINAIDPSGVGQIDLWMTRDRGQSWKLWGQDPDSVSPFPVEVTEEGVYGFRIVVRSKEGLAGRGPMRGEEADMWVQVDVTAPLVKITSVPYGRESEAGQLVVNYAVSDSNLALRPNSIQWSTNPDGPWTVIEKDLRNDGRLLWKPGQNVPRRIFLRLEAVDRAGNVGVHNLAQAIDISGLTPRGTIFGVTPVGK